MKFRTKILALGVAAALMAFSWRDTFVPGESLLFVVLVS
uniref:Uncharacterized protein n=1 Tax=Anguilla anguilla TaxID=7936 RepID=A0A0E9WJQ1_ANGAN